MNIMKVVFSPEYFFGHVCTLNASVDAIGACPMYQLLPENTQHMVNSEIFTYTAHIAFASLYILVSFTN